MKKWFLVLLFCTVVFCGCGRNDYGNEHLRNKYDIGDVVDGLTVVDADDDKFLLREGVDENGMPIWILDYDDDGLNTPTTVISGSGSRFVAFLPDYYIGIHDDRDKNPDILHIDAKRKYNKDYILSCLEIPEDPFIKIPLVEQVRSEGNEVWFGLRYYVAEDTPADDLVEYHMFYNDTSAVWVLEQMDT